MHMCEENIQEKHIPFDGGASVEHIPCDNAIRRERIENYFNLYSSMKRFRIVTNGTVH